ncbi:MAG TPA: C25 family cysteine peptidase, partial [Vicinamibacteria bacterium]
VLELRTEGFFATPQDDGTVAIEIPGFVNEAEEGAPSIPVKRSWIEAQPGRGVRLQSVEVFDEESISGLRPAYAGAVEVVASPNGTLRASLGRRARVGKTTAGASSVYARLLASGYQENVKKALLEMEPLRWDPVQENLALARRLVVRLQFAGPEERGERRRGRGRDLSRSALVARLVTRERGLYALRYEDLVRATRRLAPTSSLRLSRLGISVPYHLEPPSHPFGPGSTLYFMSDGASLNPYGREAIYELEWRVSGPTMERIDARGPASVLELYWQTVEREENRYYQAGLLDAPDLWLWDLVSGGETKSFPFELSALRPGDAEPRLEVHLQGASDFLADPDHHVRISVNGVHVAESSWNGKTAVTVAADVPFSILREGENLIEIENVGDTGASYSMVMLDRFSLSYPRLPIAEAGSLSGTFHASGAVEVAGLGAWASVLDLTEESPRWLRATVGHGATRFEVDADHRYLVSGREALLRPGIRASRSPRLAGSARSASYLAIGPRSYLDAASELLRLRREQGLTVEAVATEDIYDEFGYGEKRPEAIRDFIAYAYDSWGTPTAPL